MIRWGDPVLPGAPEFDFDNQTRRGAGQAVRLQQRLLRPRPAARLPRPLAHGDQPRVHDRVVHVPRLRRRQPDTEKQAKIALGRARSVGRDGRAATAHGQARRPTVDRRSTTAGSRSPRRSTVTGPAAGSKFLKTSADPTGRTVLGTQNNCAGGVTPWGTILSGEENFNQYFANATPVTDPVAKAGSPATASPAARRERKWERFDKRFDLAQEPNEANRFGWIVEIDPLDPDVDAGQAHRARPVQARGRERHRRRATAASSRTWATTSASTTSTSSSRTSKMQAGRQQARPRAQQEAAGRRARCTSRSSPATARPPRSTAPASCPTDGEFDGSGEWIALARNDKSFVPGFTAEEVYVFTRQAADKVGATKMDRPEDVEPSPTHRPDLRGADQQHRPRQGGQGRRRPRSTRASTTSTATSWSSRSAAATTRRRRSRWQLLLVCGDPTTAGTYFGGFDKSQVSPISCPDNVAFDSARQPVDLHRRQRARLQRRPVRGARRGHATAGTSSSSSPCPTGAETCGPVINDDFVLVSVQHPGELDGASGGQPAVALAGRRHLAAASVRRGGVAQGPQEDLRLIVWSGSF